MVPYTFDLNKAKECMQKAGYDYSLLTVVEAPPTPYLQYAGISIASLVIGFAVGFYLLRLRKS